MKCIYCGSKQTRAVDTRIIKDDKVVKRRRKCIACGKRFTTYEQVIVDKGNKRKE